MLTKSFDLQLIISISRGNNDLIEKLIQVFLQNTPLLLKQLETAYREKDLQRFRNLLNEMRPSFGYFSIRDVEADLEMAERLALINFSGKSMSELINRIIANATCILNKIDIELQKITGIAEGDVMNTTNDQFSTSGIERQKDKC